MKLHLPTGLRAALIAALTAVGFTLTQAQADTMYTQPTFGGPEYHWVGGAWQEGNPSRQGGKGPVLNFEDVGTVNISGGIPDTSDSGGIKVTGNSIVTTSLGGWAGYIIVGQGSTLTASYNNDLKSNNLGENEASVYVEGQLKITGRANLWMTDGNSAQRWLIGEEGFVDLSGVSNVVKSKAWNVQLNVDAGEPISLEGYTNRTLGGQLTKKFMSTGADLYGKVDSWAVFREGTQLDSSAYTISHDASGMSVTYDVETAIKNMTLTWKGGEGTWEVKGTHWTDGGGTTTSFANGDDVIFGSGNHTANVSEALQVGAMTVEDGSSLALAGTGTVTASVISVSNATINVGNGTSLTTVSLIAETGKKASIAGTGSIALSSLVGAIDIAEGTTVTANAPITLGNTAGLNLTGSGTFDATTLNVTGGTHTIASGLNISGGGEGKGDPNRKLGLAVTSADATINLLGNTNITGAMYANAGTVTVGDGTNVARVETNRIEFGDSQGGEVSTLNIQKNATVHVKGADDPGFANTGMLLGEWDAASVANIYGNLYGDNTTAYVGDKQMTINIEDGGVMAVKGVGITANKGGKSQTIILNLKDNGTLVLGQNGMSSEKPLTATLGSGEVGISNDNVVIGAAVTLAGGTAGTTFNTAMYTWEGEGATLELKEGATGGTLTISGNITGNGTIIKKGEGTLVFTGQQNSITHTIDLQKGTLDVSNAVLDVSGISGGGMETTYSDGQNEGNGFASTSGTLDVVDVGSATLTYEGVQVLYNGAVVTMDSAGDVTLSGVKSLTTFYVNEADTTESLQNAWNKSEKDGTNELTTVILKDGTKLAADAAVALATLTVEEGADAELNVTANTTITKVTGATEGHTLTVNGTAGSTLAIGAAGANSFTGAGNLVINEGATVLLQGNNTDFSGNLEINGTLKVGAGSNGNVGTNALGTDTITAARTITINSTGVLDLNGFPDAKYAYVLAGGKIINTGAEIGEGKAQMSGLSLTKESTVEAGAGHNFWLLSSSYAANTADLQGNKLVKTGAGTFGFKTTTITDGVLEAREGTILFSSSNNGNTNTVADMLLTGGTFTGTVDVKDDILVTTQANADMSAVLNITVADKTVTYSVDADKTHTQSGAVRGSGAIAKTGAGTLVLSVANTVNSITLSDGTIKASAAGALGTGGITVAAPGTLDLAVGGVLSATQTVTNSGNVILHSTLTSGKIDGGTLTLAADFPVNGDLKDVGGITSTGNGFSQGGTMHIVEDRDLQLANITSIIHGTETYTLDNVSEDGNITMSGADWSTYQLNTENAEQPAVQAIINYANEQGSGTDVLKSIVVNADALSLTNDSKTLKTSMLEGEHLGSFVLNVAGESALTVDSDCAADIITAAGSNSTITLAQDATVGSITVADMENLEAVSLTITGKDKTLKADGVGVGFDGILTLEEGVTLELLPDSIFGTMGNANVKLKKDAELAIGIISFATVNGGEEASVVVASDEPLPWYDPSFSEYSITGARITVNSAEALEIGHNIDSSSQLVNAGSGSIVDSNADNTAYDELAAQKGDIYLGNKDSVAVRNLTLGDGRTIGAAEATQTLAITVNGTASFGSGATVSSALTMANGATLDGTASLDNHDLTLASGLLISDALWDSIKALTPGDDTSKFNLFTGVSALTLAGSTYSAPVDLTSIFSHDSDIKSGKYNLAYDNGNVFITRNADNDRYWKKGLGDGTWNYDSTNWNDEDGAGNEVTFQSGYNAHFTAEGKGGENTTITLGTAISAASITVSGADYTFASNGYTLTVTDSVEVTGAHTATFDMALVGDKLKLTVKNDGVLELNAGGDVNAVELDGGTVSVAGDTLTTGSMTVNGTSVAGGAISTAGLSGTGTLVLGGCTLTFTSSTDLTGAVSLDIANDSTLATSGEGVSLKFKNTIQNSGDKTVTFTGTFDLSNLIATDGETKYVEGENPGNGFKQAQKTIDVVDGGSANGGSATLLYNGQDIGKMNTDGVVTFAQPTDYSTFYVNESDTTEKVSKALSKFSPTPGTFVLANNTTLEVDMNNTVAMSQITLATAAAANLVIDSGSTVTTDGTTKAGLTLKGTGELAVASGKTTTGVELDEADWKGTVSFKDASLATGLSEDWGTANSTVALQNARGTLGNTIGDYALELRKTDENNKWGFGTSTGGENFIARALKGDGDLGVREGSDATTFTLYGTTDDWTGNFVDNSSGEVINSLLLNGDAKTIHGTVGGVLDADGKPAYAANLYVEASVNTTFEKAVMAGAFVTTGATTLKENSTIGILSAGTGNLSLADNKTLTIRESMAPGTNFNMGAGAKVVLEENANMGHADNQGLIYVGGTDGATITNSAETQQTYSLGNDKVTVNGAKLQFLSDNDVVVNNELTNVSADNLALNHSLELNNVTDPLTVGTSLSIGANKTFKVAKNNGADKQTVVMGEGSTLTTAEGAQMDANLIVNTGVILNMADTLNLNGGALTLFQSATLTGDLYSAIEALEDSGASVNLFKGVSSLTLDTTPYSGSTQAQLYFSNLADLGDKGDYWLEYNADTDIVSIRFEATSAHTLTWNGTADGHSWVQNDDTMTNWLEGSPAAPAYFQEGDNAKFTADAAVKTVTIAQDITARNITIGSDTRYTFENAENQSITANSFKVGGNTGLFLEGEGKLTLDILEGVAVTDAFLSVAEGSLDIGTDTAPGKITLTRSTLDICSDTELAVATIEGDEESWIYLDGTLTASRGSVSNIVAKEGSTLKIDTVGTTAADTLTVATDTYLYGLENHGTLDLGTNDLTLMEKTEQGGNVIAGKLTLAETGSTFGELQVNAVQYGLKAADNATLDAENPNLVVESIAPAMVIPSIALDVTETMGDGGSLAAINRLGEKVTYTLIRANDQTLDAADFVLVGEDLLIQNGLLSADGGLVAAGNDLNLTVGGLDLTWYTSKDETEWGYQVVDETGALTDGTNTLNGVQHVAVDASREVDVTGVGSEPGLRVRNLAGLDGRTITFSGEQGDTVNLVTTEATASNVNLAAENITVKVGLDALDGMDPVDYKDLRVGDVDLTGATLAVHDHEGLDDAFTVNRLSGDGNSLLKGRVIVEGKGGAYRGGYEDAVVILHENAQQLLYAGKGLTVAGPGAAKLAYVGPEAHMDAIEGIGMTVTLNDPKQDNSGATLVLDKASYLVNGTIVSGMSAINSAATLDTAGAPNLVQAAKLNLDGTTIILNQDAADDAAMAMAVNDNGKTKGLYLAHLGAEDSNTDRVLLNGYLYNKYYQNARLQGGKLLVDRREAFFSEDVVRATTENGRAGAGMLDDALLELNPQVTNPQGDLAAVMTALEKGAVANPDRVASAMAGASAAALGHAFNNDVQRQLRAIRNRTTTMGLAECTTHEGLPYVNAWVNAEGDYRKLDADGTLAGYTLSSWGGTIGCDVDLTNRLTVGAAFTVLHGEFTSHSADMCEGDLDRDYVSLFARYGYRAWTHTFVATLGFAKSKVDRTVNYGTGSYATRGDADGNAFGFLYEVGYTKALNEDASTCLQPIFNVNYRHSSLGGYTEKGGSDAALNVGSADMDAVTFGLGARLQSIVGTSVYNRATLFEGRVLAKLDAGDRDCSTNSSLIGVGRKHSVKSAEVGAFGVEVGAGLTIPVGETGGSIFMDVTGDFRSGYTEFNGTVGYRFSF